MSQRKEEVALGGAWHEEADTILMLAICKMSAQACKQHSRCCSLSPLCTFVVVLVVPNPTTVTSWPTSPRLGARTGSEKDNIRGELESILKENQRRGVIVRERFEPGKQAGHTVSERVTSVVSLIKAMS